MSNQRLFVVLGATGAQGRSVIDNLAKWNAQHADKAFKIRGVARNLDSSSANALKSAHKDLELLSANMTKPDELQRAIQGAHTLFAVTAFWDPETKGRELQVGKQIADLAKKLDVQYVYWSELANAEKVSGSKWPVPHFSAKAKIGDYFRSIGLKTIAIAPGFYYQNWLGFLGPAFKPKRAQDGALEWILPCKPSTYFSQFDVDDTGKVVAAILDRQDEFVGKYIPIAAAHMTAQQTIDEIGSTLNIKTRLVSVSREDYNKSYQGAKEISDMLGWFEEYQYYGPGADLDLAKKLTNNGLTSFKDFILKNADKIKSFNQ